MSVTINGTNGLVFNDASTQNTSAFTGGFAMRNRIINGACVIDQRNAGASVTPIDGQYSVDRWAFFVSQSSKLTTQQSSVAPAGFRNSLLVTSSSAYSSGANDYFVVQQTIEGYNVADMEFGAAGAATFTISFWVRSSLTGTFGGSTKNLATNANRSYPFTYTINSANTWEQKTVTITGDTTGTWNKTTGSGLCIDFNLGTGATYSGTAGAWAATNYLSATGATSVVGTNGATFYITGVQLEKGSTATSFDYRPYGTELQLAQRYFETYVINNSSSIGNSTSGTAATTILKWYVPKRTTPSLTLPTAGTSTGQLSFLTSVGGFATTVGANTVAEITVDKATILGSGYTGLTSPGACIFYSNGTSTIQISAEL